MIGPAEPGPLITRTRSRASWMVTRLFGALSRFPIPGLRSSSVVRAPVPAVSFSCHTFHHVQAFSSDLLATHSMEAFFLSYNTPHTPRQATALPAVRQQVRHLLKGGRNNMAQKSSDKKNKGKREFVWQNSKLRSQRAPFPISINIRESQPSGWHSMGEVPMLGRVVVTRKYSHKREIP